MIGKSQKANSEPRSPVGVQSAPGRVAAGRVNVGALWFMLRASALKPPQPRDCRIPSSPPADRAQHHDAAGTRHWSVLKVKKSEENSRFTGNRAAATHTSPKTFGYPLSRLMPSPISAR
jgi:hypothetical protein